MNKNKLRKIYHIWRDKGLMKAIKRSYIHILWKLKSFPNTIFYLAYDLTPQQKNLVLCGSYSGDAYRGNSRAVFEYIQNNDVELKAVWITKSNSVFRQVTEMGYPVVHANSIRGLTTSLRSNIGLITHSNSDIFPGWYSAENKMTILYLSHGNSPKDKRTKKKSKSARRRNYKNIAIAESDFQAKILSKKRGYEMEEIRITGYPRHDRLLSYDEIEEFRSYRFVILYAPTQRRYFDSLEVRFFPFEDFDADSLINFLEREQTLLLLRPHPSSLKDDNIDLKYLWDLSDRTEYIQFAMPEEYPDVNQLLPSVDLLITDYSSIYTDFLLFDRPIIFIPYDYSDFQEKQGFVYDYFKNLPGPVVSSHSEFLDILSKLGEEDIYAKKRNDIKGKIHKYGDGNSSKRVVQLLEHELL